MIAGAKLPELQAKLSAHLEETKQQAGRLETIAELLETKASGKVCVGMEGILKEGSEALAEDAPPAIYDLGIIGAARRVEHYEMAGYMTAVALSEGLKLNDVTALLTKTLDEEKKAEQSLLGLVPKLLGSVLSESKSAEKAVAAKS